MRKHSRRHTTRREIIFEGAGLHTGKAVQMRFIPEDTGGVLVFIFKGIKIPASIDYARSHGRFTYLESTGIQIITVEHFLSACFALSITDGVVALTGDTGELPVLDGSAKEFMQCMIAAGVEDMGEAEAVEVERKLEKTWEGGTRYRVREHEGLAIRCVIDYPSYPSIGRQSFFLEITQDAFSESIAPAKTYALYDEIKDLMDQGLGTGGNEKNTIVYGTNSVINPEIQTFRDEAVRHKLLDFIGDLYLFNPHVLALFDLFKPGHRYSIEFLRFLKNSNLYTRIK